MELVVKNKQGDGVCLIDDEDAHLVEGKLILLRGRRYPAIKDKITKEQEYIHRVVMGAKKGQEIDHINRDKMDNRKCNLRFATRSENNMNTGVKHGRYKGVSWHKGDKKWRARIHENKTCTHLGNFDTKEEAALAYDRAAIEKFGEFACVNFKNNTDN